MIPKIHRSWTAVLLALAMAAPAYAQKEQFIPVLVYRTGVYAVSGVPYANGEVDYYRLVNERDFGINGIKIVFEECETGYATDRGLECYEPRGLPCSFMTAHTARSPFPRSWRSPRSTALSSGRSRCPPPQGQGSNRCGVRRS
jgi:Periplasmic binding protein